MARCAEGKIEVARVMRAGCCGPGEAIRSIPNGATAATGLHEAEATADRGGAAAKVLAAGICETGKAATRRDGRMRFVWWPEASEPAKPLEAYEAHLLMAAGDVSRVRAAPMWRRVGRLK
jgi:hypothetical protein